MSEEQAREQENNTENPGAEKQETPPEKEGEGKKPETEEGGEEEEKGKGEQESESEAGSEEGKKKTEEGGGEEEKKKSESGKPEAKDAYDFKAVLPKEVPEDDPVVVAFKETFHELGLTQDQGAGIVKFFAKFERGQAEERGKMVEVFEKQLKADWGDKYEANKKKAVKALGRFASEQYMAELKRTGQDLNPETLRIWHRVGEAISEDTFVHGDSASNINKNAVAKEDEELYGGIKK